MARRATPGLNESVEQLYARFPIGCPLALIAVGVVLWVVGMGIFHASQTGMAHNGRLGITPGPIGVVLVIIGLGVLPFGIRRVVRRRRNVIVLRCPRCGAESRSLAVPFTVNRWSDVPYASVTCSQCGADWTVDKTARLE